MSIFIAGVFSILEMSVRRLLSRLGSRAMAQWQSVQSPGRRAPNLRLSSLVSKPPDQPPPAERLPPRGLDVEGHQLGPPPPPAEFRSPGGAQKATRARNGPFGPSLIQVISSTC